MSSTNVAARSLHDVGLAAWFGGTLANAVALNAASAHADSPEAAGKVTTAGWDRWTPVNAAAIAAHLIGGLGVLAANRGRVGAQQGVATMTIVKTGLTGAALAATAWSRVAGRKVSENSAVPLHDATTPHDQTPDDVVAAQRQLNLLQWAVPALTGALLIVNSFAGEQQRPANVIAGVRDRLTS